MKITDYKAIVEEILSNLTEGVHVVDTNRKTIMYNSAMSKLEKMEVKDVLKKHFHDIFPSLSENDSTMLLALKNGITTKDIVQTYRNKKNQEITTINSTMPVVKDGRLIGAIEIARDITHLEKMADTILELKSKPIVEKANKILEINKYTFDNLIGKDEEFQKMINKAKKAAAINFNVLITGETGTGKELLAQSIHYSSDRKNKPFLAQNCAALPETLLEGILFGTSKGGYTGSIDRPGLFEQAQGGTLLLDEISAMPYILQGKLLRVLQENYLRRVGGSKDIPLDVRIIATINEPAEYLMDNGRLRKDLFYRINTISLNAIPLRERFDDIILLAEHFLLKHNGNSTKAHRLSRDAKIKLMTYKYPGNVRELENIIIAAITMSDGEQVLDAEHLDIPDLEFDSHESLSMKNFESNNEPLNTYLERIEFNIIKTMLRANNENISKTAESLGLKRQTLQHKINKYGLF